MVTPTRLLVLLTLLTPLLVVAPGAARAPVAAPHQAPSVAEPAVSTSVTAAPGAGSLRVVVANVREGSLVRHPADLRAGADRTAFARRALAQPGRLPDVLLLQEVLGTAGLVARALSAQPRARSAGARYAVATTTAHWRGSGACAGPRNGSFSVLRSSAVLVNTATVPQVTARGTIRTWGRWNRVARPVTGRDGLGCTEHPWVRLVARTPAGAVSATVLSAHAAPLGIALKNQALETLRRGLDAVRRAVTTDVTVLGGDFNLPRCRQGRERPGCDPHRAHADLVAAGWRDVVRDRAPSGPQGVAGVGRRIDFLYARGVAAGGWWDRCYQAYRVVRWPCGDRAVFTRSARFVTCQARSLTIGRPGAGCPEPRFRRYYSDHPVLGGDVVPILG